VPTRAEVPRLHYRLVIAALALHAAIVAIAAFDSPGLASFYIACFSLLPAAALPLRRHPAAFRALIATLALFYAGAGMIVPGGLFFVPGLPLLVLAAVLPPYRALEKRRRDWTTGAKVAAVALVVITLALVWQAM